jgi:hypothetical protein
MPPFICLSLGESHSLCKQQGDVKGIGVERRLEDLITKDVDNETNARGFQDY